MQIRAAALVTAIVLALVAVAHGAAAASGPMRIGLLAPDEEPRFSSIAASLRQGLREHGYGKDAVEVLEGRVPRGDDAAARATVERFAQQRVAVVFAVGSVLARLARAAAPAVPIVFVTPGVPVAARLVASLAHPGGNRPHVRVSLLLRADHVID
jgi:putative ABC transport system substrate-binding protein